MFRRRRRAAEEADEQPLAATEDGGDAEAASGDVATGAGGVGTSEDREPPAVTTGPYDEADAPEAGTDGVPGRVDLGGLQVPVVDGVEVRIEVDPQGSVIAATLATGQSAVQVGVFAAPRRSGIWAEIRAEIADSLREGGGSAEEIDGPYGVELKGLVPTGQPGQQAHARFVGVDGPRWFLRGLVQGRKAVEPNVDPLLDDVLRGVVVVRGSEAMAPRDPIPLRLPREAAAAAEASAAAAAAEAAGAAGAAAR